MEHILVFDFFLSFYRLILYVNVLGYILSLFLTSFYRSF
jgi:hypothetical protein